MRGKKTKNACMGLQCYFKASHIISAAQWRVLHARTRRRLLGCLSAACRSERSSGPFVAVTGQILSCYLPSLLAN